MTSGIKTPFGGEYESTQTVSTDYHVTDNSAPEPTVADPYAAVLSQWEVPPGQILVVRDRIEKRDTGVAGETGEAILFKGTRDDGSEAVVLGTQARTEMMDEFSPWATVLIVGDGYHSEWGQWMKPPNVRPGQRVLIYAPVAADVELGDGDGKMTVTLIAFSGIKLIQRMETA